MRALVVDDREENRYLLCQLLRGHGYAVQEADQGAQALELARPLAAGLGLPLCEGRLLRRRHTAPQSELDAAARRRNVRGCFALGPGPPLPAQLALFDDVMTTGATLHEAARLLRRAGVARVELWAVARA